MFHLSFRMSINSALYQRKRRALGVPLLAWFFLLLLIVARLLNLHQGKTFFELVLFIPLELFFILQN